jgi:hypothetical protein
MPAGDPRRKYFTGNSTIRKIAGRLTFAGSTRMLCAKRVTDNAPADDNVWLLGEWPPVLK